MRNWTYQIRSLSRTNRASQYPPSQKELHMFVPYSHREMHSFFFLLYTASSWCNTYHSLAKEVSKSERTRSHKHMLCSTIIQNIPKWLTNGFQQFCSSVKSWASKIASLPFHWLAHIGCGQGEHVLNSGHYLPIWSTSGVEYSSRPSQSIQWRMTSHGREEHVALR